MPDLLAPLQYEFVIRAIIGATIVAVVCAVVGVFVVLRGLAFLGDAIAHSAFPGVVIAFLLKVDLVIGGSLAAIGGALAMSALSRRGGLREDTAIGIVFSGMFALGIVLFSGIRTYSGDLLGVLLGDVLGISVSQLVVAGSITAVVVVFVGLFWRTFVFVSFDPTGAAASGLRVGLYDALLLSAIGVAIAVSIQIVGVVLVVAMLVTPAATARLLTKRIMRMVWIAIGLAVLSGVLGIYFSFFLNTASGGTIVLVATAIFVIVWLAHTLDLGKRGPSRVRHHPNHP